MPLRRLIDAYNHVAADYDQRWTRKVDRAEDELLCGGLRAYADGANVLDLGSGTGHLLDFVKPATYLGIDPSAGMVKQARAKFHSSPPRRFVVNTAEQGVWDVSADFYDVTTALWAFSYFEDQMKVLAGMKRALRPRGRAFVHAYTRRYIKRASYVLGGRMDGTQFRPWTADALKIALLSSGFKEVNVVGFRLLPDKTLEWLPLRVIKAIMMEESESAPPDSCYTLLAHGVA